MIDTLFELLSSFFGIVLMVIGFEASIENKFSKAYLMLALSICCLFATLFVEG